MQVLQDIPDALEKINNLEKTNQSLQEEVKSLAYRNDRLSHERLEMLQIIKDLASALRRNIQ